MSPESKEYTPDIDAIGDNIDLNKYTSYEVKQWDGLIKIYRWLMNKLMPWKKFDFLDPILIKMQEKMEQKWMNIKPWQFYCIEKGQLRIVEKWNTILKSRYPIIDHVIVARPNIIKGESTSVATSQRYFRDKSWNLVGMLPARDFSIREEYVNISDYIDIWLAAANLSLNYLMVAAAPSLVGEIPLGMAKVTLIGIWLIKCIIDMSISDDLHKTPQENAHRRKRAMADFGLSVAWLWIFAKWTSTIAKWVRGVSLSIDSWWDVYDAIPGDLKVKISTSVD